MAILFLHVVDQLRPVRTNAIVHGFARVAVPTENLKTIFGIAVLFQPAVDVALANFFSVLATVTVGVIYGQKAGIRLATTDTLVSVCCQDFETLAFPCYTPVSVYAITTVIRIPVAISLLAFIIGCDGFPRLTFATILFVEAICKASGRCTVHHVVRLGTVNAVVSVVLCLVLALLAPR